jgi:hypothetical protein
MLKASSGDGIKSVPFIVPMWIPALRTKSASRNSEIVFNHLEGNANISSFTFTGTKSVALVRNCSRKLFCAVAFDVLSEPCWFFALCFLRNTEIKKTFAFTFMRIKLIAKSGVDCIGAKGI